MALYPGVEFFERRGGDRARRRGPRLDRRYHLIEGHTLRPLIYGGRALKLSTLAVLIAILLGTEVAGVLGALAAIPIAGAIQVILGELMLQRRERAGRVSPAG